MAMATTDIKQIAKSARQASLKLASIDTNVKNRALLSMAEGLLKDADAIKEANKKDIKAAEGKGLSKAMLDRLTVSDKILKAMADGIKEVAQLPDPAGEITRMWKRPHGLLVGRMRIPIGVIGIIYEARPTLTADEAALCLKSGNAVILRGGSEAINSNLAIAKVLQGACKKEGIPDSAIQVVPTTERDAVLEMLKLEEYIDLIIPRGGEGLIRFVVDNSKIPVIKHYKGVCHIFVDEFADLDMAEKICFNAKVQRPGVCNAMETMLVHKKIAREFLPKMGKKYQDANVELRGCEETRKILSFAKPATEDDWSAEYLDLILAVKLVKDMDEAMHHIAT